MNFQFGAHCISYKFCTLSNFTDHTRILYVKKSQVLYDSKFSPLAERLNNDSIFQYFDCSVNHSLSWKIIKPHMQASKKKILHLSIVYLINICDPRFNYAEVRYFRNCKMWLYLMD